jgi:hypothetical protein
MCDEPYLLATASDEHVSDEFREKLDVMQGAITGIYDAYERVEQALLALENELNSENFGPETKTPLGSRIAACKAALEPSSDLDNLAAAERALRESSRVDEDYNYPYGGG